MDQTELDELAARGYEAFCAESKPFLPTFHIPDWSRLPDVMKNAWRAAAKAMQPKA